MTDAATVPSAAARPAAWTDYVGLLKPRVMSLVVFTALTGLVCAGAPMHPLMAFTAILCVAVGAGASGALNMAYEGDIDRLMRRTRGRPVAAGRIPAGEAATSADPGGAVGDAMGLALNWWPRAFGLHRLVLRSGLHPLAQALDAAEHRHRRPGRGPAAGHRRAAASGSRRWIAWCWWRSSSSGRRRTSGPCRCRVQDDYARAGVPMLPVVKGAKVTRRHIWLQPGPGAPALAPAFTGSGACSTPAWPRSAARCSADGLAPAAQPGGRGGRTAEPAKDLFRLLHPLPVRALFASPAGRARARLGRMNATRPLSDDEVRARKRRSIAAPWAWSASWF